MKKLLLLLLTLYISIWALSAQSQIDSLLSLLPDASGVERFEILNTLALKFWYINPDSSITFGNEALALSQELQNKEQEALAYHRLGGAYYFLSDYGNALQNYKKSIVLREELDDESGIANISNNIGMIYQELGSYDKALDSYMLALKYYESLEDQTRLAVVLNNIGAVYDDLENHDKALISYLNSLEIKQKLDDEKGIAKTLHNIGRAYDNLKQYDKALEYYERALDLKRKIGNEYSLAITLNNLGMTSFQLDRYTEALSYFEEALSIEQHFADKFGEANTLNNIGRVYLQNGELVKAKNALNNALKIAEEINAKFILEASYLYLSQLFERGGEYEKSLEYYKKMFEVNQQLFNEKVRDKIAILQTRYETEKKDQEIELLVKERDIQNLTIEKQRNIRNFLIVLIFLMIVIAIIIYISLKQKQRDNKIIVQEKAKSDDLLMNIFPVRIANDLKETGRTEPELFKDASVYFSDIVGFTTTSAHLTPKELINELNEIFTAFDEIIEKYNCERIKTIGDAYLAVAGMNRGNNNPHVNIVRAALANISYLKKRNEQSNIEWKIRIGIHTGDVVGGVVGIKKYIYDVFGDTINLAARMEQNSEAMKINISENTYKYIKNLFICTEREDAIVKGKGITKMYYVIGEI